MPNGQTNNGLTRIQSLLAIVTVLAAGFVAYMSQTTMMMAEAAVSGHDAADIVHVRATGKHNDRADSHYARSRDVNDKLNAQSQAIVKIEGHVEQLRSDMAEQKIAMREMKAGQREILLFIRQNVPSASGR